MYSGPSIHICIYLEHIICSTQIMRSYALTFLI